MSRAKQILERAVEIAESVEHIKYRGRVWSKTKGNHVHTTDRLTGCCIMGACWQAAFEVLPEEPGARPAFSKDLLRAEDAIERAVGGFPPMWNDQPSITQADVVAKLREAAASIEE